MIKIIYAPPRYGKTAYMSYLLNEYCFDGERYNKMCKEINEKNAKGFKLNIPKHCVCANYPLRFVKEGFSPVSSRRINPFRLGFRNPYVETEFNYPFDVYALDEAQIYLNSRMSSYYPSWQSRWYEASGHNDLDILMATQRPGLIDVNIRELACFVEILSLKVYDGFFGTPERLVWRIREIPNCRAFDRYVASGGFDKACFVDREVVAEYNVFGIYDSQSCKPKFYDGYLKHVETNGVFDSSLLSCDYSVLTDDSVSSYLDYLKKFKDEYPDKFYVKKSEVIDVASC